jgi:dCTP deaminase
MLSLPPGSNGVLPHRWIREAIAEGVIDAQRFTIPEENVQPASLDLRLGERAYRLRCSFLPGDDSVEEKLEHYVLDRLDLRDRGAILETGRPYLIELKERLALPEAVRAKANPKSSVGRVDVFTRVITDHSHRFDEIAAGYRGRLYLEVVPLSFAVRVCEDLALNQLRLSVGDPSISDRALRTAHAATPLLFRDGLPVPPDELPLAGGMFLSLDLVGGPDGSVGYCARPSAPLLDLTPGASNAIARFWEPVEREDGNRIVLSPNRFYLLMSKEAVSIPPTLAAEMTAYDPTSGELRTHYAGFFDPGFGYDPQRAFHGSRAALEVRAHDVAFMIEDGQQVCTLTFERMLEEPTVLYGADVGSSYQQQEDTLSKFFAPEGAGPAAPTPGAPTADEGQLSLLRRAGPGV